MAGPQFPFPEAPLAGQAGQIYRLAEARLEWFCLEDDDYRPQLPDAQGVLHSRGFPATASRGESPKPWRNFVLTPPGFSLYSWLNPRSGRQVKTAPLLVFFEVGHKVAMHTEKGFHGVSGAVAEVQPNYFWRVAIEEAAVAEVGIFGDDHESISLGIFPNGRIVRFMQMKREQMVRVGKQIGKAPNQFWREVVVV